MNIDPNHIQRFLGALRHSNAPSVDLFLESRPDFQETGKLAIAATLIPYEDPAALIPQDKPRWYETLFRLMMEGGPLQNNKLSVITFNYDRSLEAFFSKSLGKDSTRGTPQGGVVSPLLAYIYMHRYLRAWGEKGKGQLYRARL